MKYLQDYIGEAQTQLLKETGVFFAFSQKQFEEAKVEDVKYASLGNGTFCPISNVKEFMQGIKAIQINGIAQDIEENGIEGCIRRELYNNEAFYTGDIEDTVDRLEDYGVTFEQVYTIFNKVRNSEEITY